MQLILVISVVDGRSSGKDFSSNNLTIGTTILKAIKKKKKKKNTWEKPPYADTFGDNLNFDNPDPGPSTVTNVSGSVKCIVIILAGCPVVIQPYLATIDALVAVWLPGTEGQDVADVLFGDYDFTGKLKRTWFKTVDRLPMNAGDPHYDPLFPFGFGLTTKPSKAN
ncbi:hypothetical protein F0562_017311 [Nyssa sinensis]|uniref:beta-glucosidase n=1 Tax=Nyssa sinensis TaxID=561372 RepID=A0A5J4ZI48_9ASTE|nr:hypothetical protein F0562_017311 [Nyssa sinensis]